jgi:hypothetical protein
MAGKLLSFEIYCGNIHLTCKSIYRGVIYENQAGSD